MFLMRWPELTSARPQESWRTRYICIKEEDSSEFQTGLILSLRMGGQDGTGLLSRYKFNEQPQILSPSNGSCLFPFPFFL